MTRTRTASLDEEIDGLTPRQVALRLSHEEVTLDWTDDDVPSTMAVVVEFGTQTEIVLVGEDPYGCFSSVDDPFIDMKFEAVLQLQIDGRVFGRTNAKFINDTYDPWPAIRLYTEMLTPDEVAPDVLPAPPDLGPSWQLLGLEVDLVGSDGAGQLAWLFKSQTREHRLVIATFEVPWSFAAPDDEFPLV